MSAMHGGYVSRSRASYLIRSKLAIGWRAAARYPGSSLRTVEACRSAFCAEFAALHAVVDRLLQYSGIDHKVRRVSRPAGDRFDCKGGAHAHAVPEIVLLRQGFAVPRTPNTGLTFLGCPTGVCPTTQEDQLSIAVVFQQPPTRPPRYSGPGNLSRFFAATSHSGNSLATWRTLDRSRRIAKFKAVGGPQQTLYAAQTSLPSCSRNFLRRTGEQTGVSIFRGPGITPEQGEGAAPQGGYRPSFTAGCCLEYYRPVRV